MKIRIMQRAAACCAGAVLPAEYLSCEIKIPMLIFSRPVLRRAIYVLRIPKYASARRALRVQIGEFCCSIVHKRSHPPRFAANRTSHTILPRCGQVDTVDAVICRIACKSMAAGYTGIYRAAIVISYPACSAILRLIPDIYALRCRRRIVECRYISLRVVVRAIGYVPECRAETNALFKRHRPTR